MMHESSKDKKNDFETVMTIGIVCHAPLENLNKLKEAVKSVEGLSLVFFKVSSGRIWLKDGEEP